LPKSVKRSVENATIVTYRRINLLYDQPDTTCRSFHTYDTTVCKYYVAEINFIIVLRAAFACTDPESEKKTDGLTVFFVLSRSAQVKATHRKLMKLTPGL